MRSLEEKAEPACTENAFVLALRCIFPNTSNSQDSVRFLLLSVSGDSILCQNNNNM